MKGIGTRIKEGRVAAGLTQECLTEKVGISSAYLSAIECNVKVLLFSSLSLINTVIIANCYLSYPICSITFTTKYDASMRTVFMPLYFLTIESTIFIPKP